MPIDPSIPLRAVAPPLDVAPAAQGILGMLGNIEDMKTKRAYTGLKLADLAREQQTRSILQQYAPAAVAGDQNALGQIIAADPSAATPIVALQTNQRAADRETREVTKEERGKFANLAAALLDEARTNPDNAKAHYANIVASLPQTYPHLAGRAPAQWDEDFLWQLASEAITPEARATMADRAADNERQQRKDESDEAYRQRMLGLQEAQLGVSRGNLAVSQQRLEQDAKQTVGPFAGNGMDAQDSNILLKGDPVSPEYALAYQRQFGTPKMVMTDQGLVPVMVPPPPSIRPPAGTASQSAPSASATAGPVIPGTEKTGDFNKQKETIERIDQSLTAYETSLKKHGTEAVPGAAQNELKSAYTDLLIEMKNLFALGALSGPDYQLMTNSIPNPVGIGARIKEGVMGLDQFTTPLSVVRDKLNAARQRLEANKPGATIKATKVRTYNPATGELE